MSALVMMLMAAMSVLEEGPEKVSGEMRIEQRLNLSGKWKGWFTGGLGPTPVELTFKSWDVIDEGAGRMQYKNQGLTRYGIYEQRGDDLKMCLAAPGQPRPNQFLVGDGRCVFTLHRVKSRK